jgi:hypothetical protein
MTTQYKVHGDTSTICDMSTNTFNDVDSLRFLRMKIMLSTHVCSCQLLSEPFRIQKHGDNWSTVFWIRITLAASMIAGGEGTWLCFYENCMLVQRRSFADNFDLPYKSKEEVRVDAALRASEQTTNVSMSSTRA